MPTVSRDGLRLTACDYRLTTDDENMMAAPTTLRGQAANKLGRTPDAAARPLPRRGGSAKAGIYAGRMRFVRVDDRSLLRGPVVDRLQGQIAPCRVLDGGHVDGM